MFYRSTPASAIGGGAELVDLLDNPARTPTTEPDGPVLISRELFDFLSGAAGIDGVHFGEEHPEQGGKFWWRRTLRDADNGAGAEIAAIEQAIEPIRPWYDSTDHQPRPLLDVVADMAFDIKADRAMLSELKYERDKLAAQAGVAPAT